MRRRDVLRAGAAVAAGGIRSVARAQPASERPTEYLGKKYGGRHDVCREYGMRGKEWIALPIGANGGDVDMIAEAASGDKSPKEAAERAAKRAESYYKV